MKHTLTDLSQLNKAMLEAPPPKEEVKPEAPKAKPRDDGEDVLAYFSLRKPEEVVESNKPNDEVEALHARLRESDAARSEAEEKIAAAGRENEKQAALLATAQKEIERLKGECGRLRGEAARTAQQDTEATDTKETISETISATPTIKEPATGILAAPGTFTETFPGEVREMVISALSDARDAARQSTKDRRADVLDAVLAANRPSGELERRRAELKQAMKDCGYYTDPKSLEKLGFKLVSGRTHWKLEYGTVRIPMAKTPSDFRANRNMATDISNRCF